MYIRWFSLPLSLSLTHPIVCRSVCVTYSFAGFLCRFQLEYAALDAAILLVAFNQMAHDYHVHPVSVASQSHKRRLAQNALSSPPQRSFRHYIEVRTWLVSHLSVVYVLNLPSPLALRVDDGHSVPCEVSNLPRRCLGPVAVIVAIVVIIVVVSGPIRRNNTKINHTDNHNNSKSVDVVESIAGNPRNRGCSP